MVAATLILLCTRPVKVAALAHAPWLLIIPSIIIIGREITMSALREWAASQGSKTLEAVAVNNLGKWKTATQMTALTILRLTFFNTNFNTPSNRNPLRPPSSIIIAHTKLLTASTHIFVSVC
ncbi:hypothetical protein RYX36_023865 [Vicia faba]